MNNFDKQAKTITDFYPAPNLSAIECGMCRERVVEDEGRFKQMISESEQFNLELNADFAARAEVYKKDFALPENMDWRKVYDFIALSETEKQTWLAISRCAFCGERSDEKVCAECDDSGVFFCSCERVHKHESDCERNQRIDQPFWV